jgi:hypothetical protein
MLAVTIEEGEEEEEEELLLLLFASRDFAAADGKSFTNGQERVTSPIKFPCTPGGSGGPTVSSSEAADTIREIERERLLHELRLLDIFSFFLLLPPLLFIDRKC